MESFPDTPSDIQRDMDVLERSLLRRGISERTAHRDQCSRCRRTPLVGELVYLRGSEHIVCELCRSLTSPALPGGEHPDDVRVVHTPAFGHTIRIIDQRAA